MCVCVGTHDEVIKYLQCSILMTPEDDRAHHPPPINSVAKALL